GPPVALGDQTGHSGLDGVEYAGEIHIDHFLPLLLGDLPEVAEAEYAGVGYDDVEAAELPDAAVDGILHGRQGTDVRLDAEHAPAGVLDHADGFLQIRLGGTEVPDAHLLAYVGPDDAGPFAGQAHGVRPSLPAGGAGYQRHLAFQPLHDR